MKFKTPYNASDFPKLHEVNRLPSCTIPDQAMSVLEILQRHANGLPYDGTKIPVYHGDDVFIPDTDMMDFAELQEYADAVKAEKENAEEVVAEARRKKKAEKRDRAADYYAQQGPVVQRTSGSEGDQGTDNEPDPIYPKKTGGAGAQPRNDEGGKK